MPYMDVPPSIRRSFLALLIALSCLVPATAQARSGMPRAERNESRHEIDQLEDRWRDAVLHRNAQVMDGLLADDYIAITANGSLQSKEQTLNNLRSGSLHFSAISISDRKVRFYGQTALVTSRAEVTGSASDGGLTGSFRYTRVYVRDAHGVWKIVSFEVSRISGAAARR